METKVCKTCGRELPLSQFANNRYGTPLSTCRECIKEKRAQTRYDRINSVGGGKNDPFSDPDFDGRTIGDVWRQMCRAEKWLESRGCVITLDGEFREVKVRKLKKE